jgi:hypothetical protein
VGVEKQCAAGSILIVVRTVFYHRAYGLAGIDGTVDAEQSRCEGAYAVGIMLGSFVLGPFSRRGALRALVRVHIMSV